MKLNLLHFFTVPDVELRTTGANFLIDPFNIMPMNIHKSKIAA